MAKRKWFQLFDEGDTPLSNATSVWMATEDVVTFRGAVEEMYKDDLLQGIPAIDLVVYRQNRELLDSRASLESVGPDETLVVKIQRGVISEFQDVVLYGNPGSFGHFQGVDLNDKRTLSRSDLTCDIITRLEATHLLLATGPPMTGKTSLCTLVSMDLVAKCKQRKKKSRIFSFAALHITETETLVDLFQRVCGIDWDSAMKHASTGYMVYLVVDEAQMLYKNATSSPRRESTVLWNLVKLVRSISTVNFRILMFAAYGSNLQYAELGTPVEIPQALVLGIEHLNFSSKEVEEYVEKGFRGYEDLQDSATAFCDYLKCLTGGHAGLCATAIHELNQVSLLRTKSKSGPPSAQEWIRMLQFGSLRKPKDHGLFDALVKTRAVWILNTLKKEELDALEGHAYGINLDSDAGTVELCIRKGILVQKKEGTDFSSPVLWRYFVKMRIGTIERPVKGPNTLQEMILRIVGSIDYSSIRQALGKRLSNDIPLERAWQLEFYKAAHRCTPGDCFTSIDVGTLFGSRGFIDFTIQREDELWGVELLQEAKRLDELIQRFASGGQYALLGFSDYCLLDFRRVSSIDDATRNTFAGDLSGCDKLFLVCYDMKLKNVVMVNAQSVWKIPIHMNYDAILKSSAVRSSVDLWDATNRVVKMTGIL